MHRNLKNRAALSVLVRQLTGRRPFDPDEIRLQCKSVVYTCFLLGIEPFQLPIADGFTGDLSEAQKRDFWKEYLSVHMDGTKRCGAVSHILTQEPGWLSLVRLVDEIVDMQKT